MIKNLNVYICDMYQDTYKLRRLRQNLIEVLHKKGIKDEGILAAFGAIPRHYFFDIGFFEQAYEDKAFPIGCGQTISQPLTVARQTALLNIRKGEKVLEIGTGSGFQAAVLHFLGAKVYTIERHKPLFIKTTKLLKDIGYGRVRTFHGDGMKGLNSRAPFNKILVTAGATEIPNALLNQLKIGGALIIPVGQNALVMHKIVRQSENKFTKAKFGKFEFVPLLAGTE